MAYDTKHPAHLLPLAAAALLLGTASFASAQTTSPAPSATAARAGGSLQQSHNAWRSTKLDGATVYNEHGDSVGTIDDMLLDSTGKVSNVVLSVGGFLGVDSKYVEVPFSKLKFEPSKGNPAAATTHTTATGTTTTATTGTIADTTTGIAMMPAAGANNHDYSIVLPGATKDSLKATTAFSY